MTANAEASPLLLDTARHLQQQGAAATQVALHLPTQRWKSGVETLLMALRPATNHMTWMVRPILAALIQATRHLRNAAHATFVLLLDRRTLF